MSTKKSSNKELRSIGKDIAEGVAEAFQEFFASPEWKKFVKYAEDYKEGVRLFVAWRQAKRDGNDDLAAKLRKQFDDFRAKSKKEAG